MSAKLEYATVEADTAHGLTESVNLHLAEGWELWGNPYTGRRQKLDGNGHQLRFHQAMTKPIKQRVGALLA